MEVGTGVTVRGVLVDADGDRLHDLSDLVERHEGDLDEMVDRHTAEELFDRGDFRLASGDGLPFSSRRLSNPMIRMFVSPFVDPWPPRMSDLLIPVVRLKYSNPA